MSIEPFFSESEIIQSDDLIELTADINRRHALGERLGASWVENAIIIGLELLKIRNQVPIGSWCRWIDDNAEFSRVNAFRYIRVAEHQGQLRLASAKTVLEAGEVAWLPGVGISSVQK